MSTSRLGALPPPVVQPHRSHGVVSALVFLAVCAVVGSLAYKSQPGPFVLALVLLAVTLIVWFVKPLVGLCATVFFALIADGTGAPWYPFLKGFSAHESILFLSNSLIVSPLELVLGVALLAMVLRWMALGTWELALGRMPLAVSVFIGFMFVALARAKFNGAVLQVALFEMRPFFVLLVTYFLTSSVCRKLSDYRWLLWSILFAVSVHSVIAITHIASLTTDQLAETETIIDHGAAMRMDVLILVALASWIFVGGSKAMRWFTTVMVLPVGFVYLTAERRAAVVGLVVALAFMAIVLFWHRRRAFFAIVPVLTLLLAAYVGAFWNSTSSAAFPAQAVKSVVASSSVSDRNQSSDYYRFAENIDLHFTIQQARIRGIGLGTPFYQPYRLPALSSNFDMAAYIPHNSFLWIWMVSGIGGFAAMIYMIARAVSLGAATLRTWDRGPELIVLLGFVLAVVAFIVFCYVDIAWDAANMAMLGPALAACANYPRGPANPRPPTELAAIEDAGERPERHLVAVADDRG